MEAELLIVAKTKMGNDHCCIGALCLRDGMNYRLLDSSGQNQSIHTDLEVGDIIQAIFYESAGRRSPHNEDVLLTSHIVISRGNNVYRILEQFPDKIKSESIYDLFQNEVRRTESGTLYIPETNSLQYSVGFYIARRELNLLPGREGWATKYRSEIVNGINVVRVLISYVGYTDPIERIPEGALLRISLSRIFRKHLGHEGYYLQLSGWF